MSRDPLLYLEDIRGACEKVIDYTRDFTFSQFVKDSRTYDAVVRNLEIIGEATKRLPAEITNRVSAVDWRKIAGLRDFLAHAYFGIDDDILWDVVRNKTPELLREINRYFEQESLSFRK